MRKMNRKTDTQETGTLQATVNRLWNRVPSYRAKMEQAGITPSDIRGAEDLCALPFTTKQDLRDAYPFGLLACGREELLRVHASSGTTGKMTIVAYTENDIKAWKDCMANCLAIAGVTNRDTLQVMFGYGLFTGGLGFHYGGEHLGATVIPSGTGFTERQVQLMQDLGTTVIACTPSYAVHLSEVLASRRKDHPESGHSLKAAILGAEPWSEALRQTVQEGLGVPALDIYGLSEVMGPGVAIECPCQDGLHLNGGHFLAEIIDPVTGERLPDGQEGELVITTLTKEALPLARYRTRDLTRILPGKCPCGREGIRIARIRGRSDDMLIIKGVNVFPTQVEAALGRVEGLSMNYTLEVTEKNYVKDLAVSVESASGLGELEMERLEKQAVRLLHEALGLRVAVKVLLPGSLERFEGKAKRVRVTSGA
jgi:phenylacetate-CoA ligase